jgi:BCL2-associated athanogene 3
MDEVEKFQATTRKDKHYLYLDEMLTQNLLRLDTVDTEGKENIKQARREAIKCINHCISVLEAKTEAAETELRNNGGVPTAANTQENRSQSMEPQLAPSKSNDIRPTGSASADNVLKRESTNNNNNEQSAELKKSSSKKK